MKNYIKLLCILLVISSCDEFKNSAEISATTFLPVIEVVGEDPLRLDCTVTSYTDEGAKATAGENTLDLTTVISSTYFGSLAIDKPDLYSISYSAANSDSIPGSATRSVLWPACNGDLITNIAGMYTSGVTRTGGSGGPVDYKKLDPYFIVDLGENRYAFSGAIGKYYESGKKYGAGFAAKGLIVTANDIATNDFTITNPLKGVGSFGGMLEVSNIKVDAVAKTISFTTDWSVGTSMFQFKVVLTQVSSL